MFVTAIAGSPPKPAWPAETPEEVAGTIGRAPQFVPREHLTACTHAVLAPTSRAVAAAS